MILTNDDDIIAKTHNDIYGDLRDDILIKGMVTELQNTPIHSCFDTIEAQFKIYFDQPMYVFMPGNFDRIIPPFKASQATVFINFCRYKLVDLICSHVATGDNILLVKIKNCIGQNLRQAGFDVPLNMDEVKFTAEYIPRT